MGRICLSVSHVGLDLHPLHLAFSKRLPVVTDFYRLFYLLLWTASSAVRSELHLSVARGQLREDSVGVLDATTLQECSSAQIAVRLSIGVKWLSKPPTRPLVIGNSPAII